MVVILFMSFSLFADFGFGCNMFLGLGELQQGVDDEYHT
jgi:hypothetical protein